MDKNSAKKKKLSLTTHENAMTEEPSKITKETAEEKIQHFLILKAWRHQKERNKRLEADVKTLSNQVDSLQLQIYTLKSLLEAEKNRVVHVNNDFRKILTSLEESNHEKQSLVKEKEQYEVRLRHMEEKLGMMETEYKNQKNELLTAKNEAQTWENQLEKEREKLTKMKDDRKCFIEEAIPMQDSKETSNSSGSRKASKESRVKNVSSKSGKKNTGRGREDRGVGKVDFGKNVSTIKNKRSTEFYWKKLIGDKLLLYNLYNFPGVKLWGCTS